MFNKVNIKNTNKYGEIKIAYNSRSYKEGRNYTIFFHGIKALFVIIKEKIIKWKIINP